MGQTKKCYWEGLCFTMIVLQGSFQVLAKGGRVGQVLNIENWFVTNIRGRGRHNQGWTNAPPPPHPVPSLKVINVNMCL